MGEKEKENEVPAGSIGTDGRNDPENAISKSEHPAGIFKTFFYY
jgi:hypothetical protein